MRNWQLTYRVEKAEDAEGWALIWSGATHDGCATPYAVPLCPLLSGPSLCYPPANHTLILHGVVSSRIQRGATAVIHDDDGDDDNGGGGGGGGDDYHTSSQIFD